MIYLIADTHGQEIPDGEMDFNDTLIHVGDYGKGNIPLRPRSVLVLGNHDEGVTNYNSKFDFICEGVLLDHVWFTHEPAFSLPLGAHYNIHGHLHENDYEDYGYIKKPFHIRLLPNLLYKLDDLIPHHD